MWESFFWLRQVRVFEKFTHLTELLHNCHIFECVKNDISVYILHPIEIETRILNKTCILMIEINSPPQIIIMQNYHQIIALS